MILRPQLKELRVVAYYLGKILVSFAFLELIPLALALILKEFDPALDFGIGFLAALSFGLALQAIFYTQKFMDWAQGLSVASITWLLAMVFSAIPLYLSGHWASFLDACFETMSGLATTGLTLAVDLDHLSFSHNLWRHLIMFVGGQGIVIIALSFFVKGFSGAFKMYVGEARDERIMPNVIDSARFIWLVSLVYLVLGTLSLGICGMAIGLKPFTSFFHGACVFMAAFDTGGFTPQSQNILYYHSFAYELITVFCMFLGAINFKLHYAIWMGNRKEMFRNIETVTLFLAVVVTFLITVFGLRLPHTYSDGLVIFRKGFYQLVSGHTGTGFSTIYAKQFINEWGNLALVGIILAMGLGGATCSTTGAIKMLRLGVVFKALAQDIKKVILPEKTVVVQRFHHIKTLFLDDKLARSALLITLLYILLYLFGAIVGMFFGYPFLDSLFESTSAAANVGLSCGITQVSMPIFLKITYILQMWIGRLEFISVFKLGGLFLALFKGRK